MQCSLGRIVAIVIMVGFLAGIAVGITLYVINSSDAQGQVSTFPDTFKFGAASASYQIEGAWDEDGKSPNIWDTLVHSNPNYVNDRTNADVAANSYHFYEKDIEAIENIGFEVYRFSISWSRIIPVGSKVNEAGVAYYNKLIDGLLAKNIKPLVTIFHWDLPQYIQDLGGWTNPIIVDYFKVYADVLFERFGDRVEDWITINEPSVYCGEGYGYTTKAPAIASPGVGDYLCQHHSILASATAYRLYHEKYAATQKGRVGICLNSGFSYPYNSTMDPSVVEKAMLFDLGRFAHPVFLNGEYPEVMVQQIGDKSKAEGRPWSRLPEFTPAQKELVRGSADFLALNYYTSRLTWPRIVLDPANDIDISWSADTNLDTGVKDEWKVAKSQWLYSVPEGLHDILVWIKDTYTNPTVMITENGWSDGLEVDATGAVHDTDRVNYLKAHLASVARAVNDDKCNVVAYTVWSLTDNFEWKEGFAERFGIHYINFTSPDKTRVPKDSALFFKEFMKSKSFEI